MSEVHLSVVIPAYNESQRLPRTLGSVLAYLQRQTYPWEVLVVDDGSADGTAELTRRQFPAVQVISYAPNRGKGHAVRQGMLASQGDWVLMMDADGATDISELDAFWPQADNQRLLISSRAIKGVRLVRRESRLRELVGKLGNLFIQTLLLPGIWDSQNGFKLFPGTVTRQLFQSARLDGWGFDFEILFLARQIGLEVRELPITWRHDDQTRVRPGDYPKVLRDLAAVRWWWWTGAYREVERSPKRAGVLAEVRVMNEK